MAQSVSQSFENGLEKIQAYFYFYLQNKHCFISILSSFVEQYQNTWCFAVLNTHHIVSFGYYVAILESLNGHSGGQLDKVL